MNTAYIKERFDQLQLNDKGDSLQTVRSNAFANFSKLGIPTSGTRIVILGIAFYQITSFFGAHVRNTNIRE